MVNRKFLTNFVNLNDIKDLLEQIKICGIYKIVSPTGKIYVGQAIDIQKRWNRYINMHKCVNAQTKLYRSFIKHGVINHIFVVVEECNIVSLIEKEGYYQDYYNSIQQGLNCVRVKTLDKSGYLCQDTKDKIGKSNTGKIPSIEKRKTMSKKMSGKNNPMYGKKGEDHPAFGRTKELNGMYGKKHSEITKATISDTIKNKYKNIAHPNTGRVFTEETRIKMANSKIGKKLGSLNTSSKKVVDKNTGVVYDTIKEAAEKNLINYATLLKKLQGKIKNNTSLKYFKND